MHPVKRETIICPLKPVNNRKNRPIVEIVRYVLSMSQLLRFLTILIGIGWVFFVSLYQIHTLPPVHYDEAWFGQFANRIAFEPSFWPLEAMNSYTGPILHYFLALTFRVFGAGVETSRYFFLGLNLATLGALALLIRRISNGRAVAVFVLFFGLLPVSVFSQRIQLEVTSWFALCYSVVLWGIVLWNSKPTRAICLIAGGIWLGLFSHILFFIVPFSLFGGLILERPEVFRTPRAKLACLIVNLPLVFLPLKMGLNLRDVFPFFLALGFLVLAVLPYLIQDFTRLRVILNPKKIGNPLFRFIISIGIGILALAVFAASLVYFLFEFSGSWPYAQITGELRYFWLPLNLIFLLALVGFSQRKKVDLKLRGLWLVFFLQIGLTGWSVLKATNAKYWTIPTLTLLIGLALLWGEYSKKVSKKAYLVLAAFTLWNAYLFQECFANQYRIGPHDRPFRVWRLSDSARYYRPAVPAYLWLREKGCHLNKIRVDDGRLQFVVDYYQEYDRKKASPNSTCPWGQREFYFGNEDSAPAGFQKIEESPIWPDMEMRVQDAAASNRSH